MTTGAVTAGIAQAIMKKVLVVGGGLTGSVTCSLLADPVSHGYYDLLVWDKARGAGGRMSTSRSQSVSDCTVDLGAQYISANKFYNIEHKGIYDDLLANGILSRVRNPPRSIKGLKDKDPETIHYVAPHGTSAIVKHFLAKSKATVGFGHHVSDITLFEGKWVVSTQTGVRDAFDAVVLTLPVPQALKIPGTIQELYRDQSATTKRLEAVEYSSRYALGLFYDKPMSNDELGIDLEEHSYCQYMQSRDQDHPFRYLAVDDKKRNDGDKDGKTSVVLHTSIGFGKEHVEKTPAEVRPLLEAELVKAFPNINKNWSDLKCQKWRFSQVTKAYTGTPGYVVLHEDPLLIVGGDGFTHSNFDGCVASARNMVETIRNVYKH